MQRQERTCDGVGAVHHRCHSYPNACTAMRHQRGGQHIDLHTSAVDETCKAMPALFELTCYSSVEVRKSFKEIGAVE
eukprot:1909564-Pleurochrysis_carterae.AAC.3